MNGNTLTTESKWYTEPLKRIANITALVAAAITAVLAILNQTDVIELVPEHYRTKVTAVIAGLGVVLTILHKVQGALGRNGVPGTNFNGMVSPAHVHDAMVQSAQPSVTPIASSAPATVSPMADDHPLAGVGALLGTNVDGEVVADPITLHTPEPVAADDGDK